MLLQLSTSRVVVTGALLLHNASFFNPCPPRLAHCRVCVGEFSLYSTAHLAKTQHTGTIFSLALLLLAKHTHLKSGTELLLLKILLHFVASGRRWCGANGAPFRRVVVGYSVLSQMHTVFIVVHQAQRKNCNARSTTPLLGRDTSGRTIFHFPRQKHSHTRTAIERLPPLLGAHRGRRLP